MKSYFNRALALFLTIVMLFAVSVPAFSADCAHIFTGWTVSKPATCAEQGELSRTCTTCGHTETMTTLEAHDYVETTVSDDCTKGGTVKISCKVCGNIKEETAFEGRDHIFGEVVTDKLASCTEDGKSHTECTVCGFYKEEIIEKFGHSVKDLTVTKEATCTEDGKRTFFCNICNKEIEEAIPALGHVEVILEAVEATCTESGLTEGKSCSRCKTVYEEQEEIPALGHEEINMPELAPTCTETGLTAGVVCKVCGYSIVKSEEIPAKGHTKTTVPATEPTCTTPGYTEGEKCADCDYIYTPQQEIPKLNHEHRIIPPVPSTCLKTGLTEGRYCDICDIVIKQQEVTPAAGHMEVFYQAISPTCDEVGYKSGKRCSVCGKITTGLEEVPALGHTEEIYPGVPATCTSAGKSESRKCLVCGKVTKEQVVIPATGHSEVVDYAVSASCQKTGLTEGRHCLRCKTVIVKQQTVPKAAHFLVTIDAVDATCTKAGKTAGERCAVCDLVTITQKSTLPLGHTSKSKLTTATLSADGALITYCDRCNKTMTSTPIKKIKSIKLSSTEYTYDGKVKKPSVTVTDSDGKKLIKDTDYTLKYSSGRKNPGVYKVKVTFKGNYSGSKTYSFTIAPKKTTVTATQTVNTITLKWKAVTGAYGYRVYLYNSSSSKWTTLIKSTKDTSYTFKSLSAGTTYKYAVRPYAKDGSVIWGKMTEISVTTKPEAPAISSVSSPSAGSFTAKWNKVTGATGYVVYYATSKNGKYTKLGSTKERTFTATKLKSNKNYYVKVKAYIKTADGNLYSSASAAKIIYVK